MTFSGRDPHRESRRAGDSRSGNQSGNDADRYVMGADGKPLRDRYGRPVTRRDSASAPRRTPRTDGRGSAPFRAVDPRASRQQPEHTRYDLGPHQSGNRGAGSAHNRPQQQMPPVQRQFQGAGNVSGNGRGAAGRAVAPRRSGARRKRGNPVKRFFGCAGWIVIALVISLVVFVFWTDSRLARTDALPASSSSSGSGTNWLLVGSDSRQGLSEEEQAKLGTGGDVGVGRTDTIMLLHIPDSGTAQLVSLPRDSYVNVPGFGQDKVNAAPLLMAVAATCPNR